MQGWKKFEWTIQIHREDWAQDTERRKTKQRTQHKKLKRRVTRILIKTVVNEGVGECVNDHRDK
jgi:hypothetical protein